MTTLRRSRTLPRGQVALMVTLAMPVTLGMVGLVVDVGWMYFRREAATAAAEAAALAGATQVYSANSAASSITCNSGVVWCNTTPQQCASSPTYPPQNSFDTACLYAKANGFQVGSRVNVTVQASNSTAPTAPNTSNAYYMTVRVTEQHPLTFLAVLGSGLWGSVTGRSSGGVNLDPQSPGCVYVMNPTAQKAFSMSGGNFSTGCGVLVDSNQSNAAYVAGGNLTLNNNADLTIVGQLSHSGGNISPPGNVKPNQPSFNNPFSGMTAPTPATPCKPNPNISGGNSNTISPGTYCGITISGGNNVLFSSGIYILSSGNLTVNGGNFSSTVTNVLIYIPASNATGQINISGGNMQWTGISGNGADGFVFWVANSAAQSITGGNAAINGVMYMPNSALTYSGGNGTTETIVANTLDMEGGNISSPASSADFSGGGGAAGGAFLVE
jgi:Flp pilus assembly protein TadG